MHLLLCFLTIPLWGFFVLYHLLISSLLLPDHYSSQMSCLMLAAQEGYCKVINLLVSHGAEINVQDNDGYTVSYSL